MSGWVERDLDRYFDKEQDYYDSLPECPWCRDKIHDGYGYELEGDIVCEACMEEWINDKKVNL